ncbi:hypothetical protein GF324_02220 [bacterium]|nr:hypothetical protein [bacterium]
MMKKLALPLMLLAMVVLVGCTATLPKDSVSAANFDPGSYQVLGPVEGVAQTEGLFNGIIIMSDEGGYQKAYRNALAMQSGANAIINTYSDVHVTQYLFGLYVKMETHVYGTAIKLNDSKAALNVGR